MARLESFRMALALAVTALPSPLSRTSAMSRPFRPSELPSARWFTSMLMCTTSTPTPSASAPGMIWYATVGCT